MQDPIEGLDVIIHHKAYAIASERIGRFIAMKDSRKDPVGLALLGPSGSGKTLLLEQILASAPSVETTDGTIVPVVYVSVPSAPTTKNLAEELLAALDPGEKLRTRYTEAQITSRVRTLLDECGCDVIILDEFQHFYDRTTQEVWHLAADWLKRLGDLKKKNSRAKRLIIVAGLEYGINVIQSNAQLQRRFKGILKLPCFSWRHLDQRKEFIACLQSFANEVKDFIVLPNLDNDANRFRFYCATGGLIGHLKNLLSEVILYAKPGQQSTVTLKDLDDAFQRYLCANPELRGITYRPFADDFVPIATEDNLNIAERIGNPPIPQRARGRRRVAGSKGSSFVADGLKSDDE